MSQVADVMALRSWQRGGEAVLSLLTSILTAVVSGLAGAMAILLLIASTGGGNLITAAASQKALEQLPGTFLGWVEGLFSPGMGTSWSGIPLSRYLELSWITTRFVVVALAFAAVLAAGLAIREYRRRGSANERRSGGLEVMLLAPPVLWITLITAGWNLGVRLLAAHPGLVEMPLHLLWTTEWRFDPRSLYFPFAPDGVLWIVGIVVLGLGAGTVWDFKQGMLSELERVMSQDYIMVARANGLSLIGRVIRNLAPPSLAILVGKIPVLFGEVIIVEKVFGLPGIGSELLALVAAGDAPAIMLITAYFVGVAVFARGVVAAVRDLLLPPGREVVV